jgi:hypothetical protein
MAIFGESLWLEANFPNYVAKEFWGKVFVRRSYEL